MRSRSTANELWYAVELAPLTTLAFGRMVLDSFGDSPETFVAHGARAREIVVFGLLVVAGPLVALAGVGLLARLLGPRARWWCHLALVAVFTSLAARQTVLAATDAPRSSPAVLAACGAGGVLVAVLVARVAEVRTFLRFFAVAPVILLGQFLLSSRTAELVTADGPSVDTAHTAAVAAALGEDPPDVVMVVLDALPTAMLLDGTGHVDAELFPNFARLARTSDWYRNHTTVSMVTTEAVPVILSGRSPEASWDGIAPPLADSIFTLLGGSYDIHAQETITRMCPTEVCPIDTGGSLPDLLEDAWELWWSGTSDEPRDAVDDFAAINDIDRYRAAEAFIDDFHPGGATPDLFVQHMILPHRPFQLTDDGTTYVTGRDEIVGAWVYGYEDTAGLTIGFGETGAEVGRQRFLLQTRAVDRLIGRLLDRLEAAGTLDDTMVVVTADHGFSFGPGPWRALTTENAHELAWTPLFVHRPGQTEGSVSDADVQIIDILPTVADELGIEVPWAHEGVPVDRSTRTGEQKPVTNLGSNPLHDPDPGVTYVHVDGRAGLSAVLASDAWAATGDDALWQRTEHRLVGRRVEDVEVGAPGTGAMTVERLDRFERLDLGSPVNIELVGHTELPVGTTFAFAVNGTIGVVGTVEGPHPVDDVLTALADPSADREVTHLALGLVPPRLLVDGRNSVAAYVVEGPPGAAVLRPVTLTSRR